VRETVIDEACDQLDQLGGWKALFVLDGGVSDVDALVEALPWVSGGQPRAGTMVRLLQRESGLIVLMGGQLSEKEAGALFDIHAALGDAVRRAFVVSPRGASDELVRRIYQQGLVPTVENSALPNWRAHTGLALIALAGTGFIVRVMRRTGGVFMPAVALCLLATIGFAIYAYVLHGRSLRMESDPGRIVGLRWQGLVPPFPRERAMLRVA
jgi:hypothetical protein